MVELVQSTGFQVNGPNAQDDFSATLDLLSPSVQSAGGQQAVAAVPQPGNAVAQVSQTSAAGNSLAIGLFDSKADLNAIIKGLRSLSAKVSGDTDLLARINSVISMATAAMNGQNFNGKKVNMVAMKAAANMAVMAVNAYGMRNAPMGDGKPAWSAPLRKTLLNDALAELKTLIQETVSANNADTARLKSGRASDINRNLVTRLGELDRGRWVVTRNTNPADTKNNLPSNVVNFGAKGG
jgi:hypothetical protein